MKHLSKTTLRELKKRYLNILKKCFLANLVLIFLSEPSLAGMKDVWDMGTIRPSVGITIGYDVISDDINVINTFANEGSYTVNGDVLDKFSTTISLGLEVNVTENSTLKLEYLGNYRQEYIDHSGMLRLEMRF